MKITILNGRHRSIELPLSDEELNFQMRQMGIRETIPKGKLVKVSEKDNPLQKLEGQFLNMDEVNFFARRMEHLTEYERKVLAVYANDCDVSTIKDLINLTFSMKGLSLLTDFSDASQVGVRLYTDEFSEDVYKRQELPSPRCCCFRTLRQGSVRSIQVHRRTCRGSEFQSAEGNAVSYRESFCIKRT